MTLKEAMDSLKLKFSSGNNIPVKRATITREEFEPIRLALELIGKIKLAELFDNIEDE